MNLQTSKLQLLRWRRLLLRHHWGSSISSYSWTYDTLGRAASFTAPEGTFAYGYDNIHQLKSATFTANPLYLGGTPPTESYNFDDTEQKRCQERMALNESASR